MTEQELLRIAIKEKRRQAWYFITILVIVAVSLGLGWLNSALGREAWMDQAETWQAQYLDLYDEFTSVVGEEPNAPSPDKVAEQGPQGEQGPVGPPGSTGPSGTDGSQGPSGKDGAAGQTGAPGEPGPPGSTGPKGDQGEPGAPGAAGATGPTGATGPQGVAGPTCPDGVTPTTGYIFIYDETGIFATLTRVTYCPVP